MNSTLLVSVGFMAVFAFAVTTTDMINTTRNKNGLLLAEAQQLASGITIGNNTTMGSSVTIGNNTTMGSSVTIGNNTTMGSSVTIGDNASISENTRISQGASIGDNTRISQSVNVAENVKIGRGASIGENTRIAQGANIGGGTSIGRGANIGENVAVTGGGGQINSNVTIPANATIPANVTIPQPSPGKQNLTAQATPINITTAVATPSSASCDDDGTVTLEGTVSPMVPITASWEQIGGEPDADIMGSDALISTFGVPGCDDIDGDTTLTFRLTVIDEQGITIDVASVDFAITDAVAADEEEEG
jgi:UDP-3-O-[3-hydroxymyristoyl] glucosamine N-acyltransferase